MNFPDRNKVNTRITSLKCPEYYFRLNYPNMCVTIMLKQLFLKYRSTHSCALIWYWYWILHIDCWWL